MVGRAPGSPLFNERAVAVALDEALGNADAINYMQAGFVSGDTVCAYFDTLAENGFEPDEARVRKLVDLFMNMSNAMPTWANNGWMPNELHEAYTDRKTFYNEDGSPMKVGRNDPCPCGSGEKYKKCCGR